LEKRSADQRLIRVTNQQLILDTIRKNESATRRTLSKDLQLSVPSVCTNVDQLVELGIVKETAEESTNVGRKAKTIKLNNDYGYLISIDLSNPCITLAISNLEPTIVQELKFDLLQIRLEEMTGLLLSKIAELLSISGITEEQVLAISISVPGIVNHIEGIVDCGSYLAPLGIVHFRSIFGERFNIPVLLQKDIDAAVIAEMNYGAATNCKDVVFVSADVGVGMGLVLGGTLFKGSSNAAGELCKVVVDGGGQVQGPVNRLVDLVSVDALVEAIKADIASGKESSVLERAGDHSKIDFNTIIQATLAGDAVCVEQVANCARIMGTAVANMLLLLDLECIVLGGGFVALGETYTRTLAEEVQKHRAAVPNITVTQLKNKAVLMGGISMGLTYIFEEWILDQISI